MSLWGHFTTAGTRCLPHTCPCPGVGNLHFRCKGGERPCWDLVRGRTVLSPGAHGSRLQGPPDAQAGSCPGGLCTFVVPKQGLLRSAQTPVDVLQLLCHQRDLHWQHCQLHLGSRGSCRRELRAGGNPLCPLGCAPRVRLGVPGHQHRAGRSRCLGSATPTCQCRAGVP